MSESGIPSFKNSYKKKLDKSSGIIEMMVGYLDEIDDTIDEETVVVSLKGKKPQVEHDYVITEEENDE